MTAYSWGGTYNNTSSYTDYTNNFIYIDGIGMPTTAVAYNGNTPITIDSIAYGYASGTGLYARINYAGSGNVGSATWGNSGGTFRFVIGHSTGRLYFGRNTGISGTAYDSADGLPYSNGIVPGSFQYYGSPNAPTAVSGSASASVSGKITVTWTPPSSDGGAAITGYDIYQGATLLGSVGAVTTYDATGLTPGTAYTFTVRAKNSVTTAAGTTSQASSASSSVTAPGVPTAPQSLSGTPSTTVTGRINLSWSAPSVPGTGGITGYNIFRNGTQIATTTGTGTTYAATGLTAYTSYAFTVKARNAFADANSVLSVASNTATATAPGPPGAPTALTAVADILSSGEIDLSWTAPAVTGAGGITGYNVYFSTNALIVATTGTGTTYSVTGLNPGQSYTFYVTARNALADAEPSESAHSNNATDTALGEPGAPTAFTVVASTVTPGRISLAWTAPSGVLTGYSVFDHNTTTLVDTLIAIVKTTSYKIDNLTTGVTKSYKIRARNAYTDTLGSGYPGNWGGPSTSVSSATPNADFGVPVSSLVGALTDDTNVIFNGTYAINAITPTVVGYAKTASNITSVAMTVGTVTDNTNAIFNGTYTIATPTPDTFTYARTNANITTAVVTGGVVTDNTNATFNGTFVVTAVNGGARTVSYARIAAAVSSVAVPVNVSPGAYGTLENTSNVIYNGTGLVITALTATTLAYAKVNANIAESNAAGIVTDTTNRDEYNGTYPVSSIPAYNVFSYVSAGAAQSETAVLYPPSEQVQREISPAELDIKYRSGWAG